MRSQLEPLTDEGFYPTIDPRVARRQFNMSLGLVVLLTLVAMAVGLTAGFAPLEQTPMASRQAHLVVQAPQKVHVIQAQDMHTPRGG